MSSIEHLTAYSELCKRALRSCVNGPLLSKRDEVLHALSLLKSRAHELGAVSEELERALRVEAEERLEALAAAEARNLLLLESDAAELRRQLDGLDRCVAAAECALGETSPGIFLPAFRGLSEDCERLSQRPLVRADIRVSVEEYTAAASAAVESQAQRDISALLRILAVKDAMLAAVLTERDDLRARLHESMGN